MFILVTCLRCSCKRNMRYPLNQICYYTRYIMSKRVTSLQGQSPCHCARAPQLLLKRYCSGGKQLATLRPIWQTQDSNLRPPAPQTKAFPLDQLAEKCLIPKTKPKYAARPGCIITKCTFVFTIYCFFLINSS